MSLVRAGRTPVSSSGEDAYDSSEETSVSYLGWREQRLMEEMETIEPEAFQADVFLESKCGSMSEKAMIRLCGQLKEHSRVSLEDMRSSVVANYSAFIRTSKEISDLEGELHDMRNLLKLHATLIHSLAETSQFNSFETEDNYPLSDFFEDGPQLDPNEMAAQTLIENLDMLIVERKVGEALNLLEEGEEMVETWRLEERGGEGGEGRERGEGEDQGEDWARGEGAGEGRGEGSGEGGRGEEARQGEGELAERLGRSLSIRRRRLEEQLVDLAKQMTVRGEELREVLRYLYRLGEGQRAHTLLLNAHLNQLKSRVASLRPMKTSFGGAYTAALSQIVFSAISLAANDSVTICPTESPEFSSELVLWAQKVTEWFAKLVKKFALSSSTAIGGLRSSAECVKIAVGHCNLLEEKGFFLRPVLARILRPVILEALESNIIRIEEAMTSAAEVDDWVLYPLPLGVGGGGSDLKLSSSGQRLYLALQELVEDVMPVIGLQLLGPTMKKVAILFENYVDLLKKALPSAADNDEELEEGEVKTAYDESQQLALLGNASALADELLPRLCMKLVTIAETQSQEQEVLFSGSRKISGTVKDAETRRGGTRPPPSLSLLRRRLQASSSGLRELLCASLAAEFMYGAEGEALLRADHYLGMDALIGPQDWARSPVPSPAFQALCVAVNAISGTAADVLVGRERVVTLLLMRLAEWLMAGLMMYSGFWDQMDQADYALGPTGLQQLVLDMYFVMQIAANGKFSSRAMRKVALDSMARAITMYKEQTGDDPSRLLQSDAWFQARCQEAINSLLGLPDEEGFDEQQSSDGSEGGYYEEQYV